MECPACGKEVDPDANFCPNVFAVVIWSLVILVGFQDFVFGNLFVFMSLIVVLPLILAFLFLNYYVKNSD
jgi:uncharacterized protein (DUF983 family)